MEYWNFKYWSFKYWSFKYWSFKYWNFKYWNFKYWKCRPFLTVPHSFSLSFSLSPCLRLSICLCLQVCGWETIFLSHFISIFISSLYLSLSLSLFLSLSHSPFLSSLSGCLLQRKSPIPISVFPSVSVSRWWRDNLSVTLLSLFISIYLNFISLSVAVSTSFYLPPSPCKNSISPCKDPIC